MFTGLVESRGRVERVVEENSGCTMSLTWPGLSSEDPLELGESVAVNGCCLTVIRTAGENFDVQAGPETLDRTNLGNKQAGDRVNLERRSRSARGWVGISCRDTSTPRPSCSTAGKRGNGNSCPSASSPPGRRSWFPRDQLRSME